MPSPFEYDISDPLICMIFEVTQKDILLPTRDQLQTSMVRVETVPVSESLSRRNMIHIW